MSLLYLPFKLHFLIWILYKLGFGSIYVSEILILGPVTIRKGFLLFNHYRGLPQLMLKITADVAICSKIWSNGYSAGNYQLMGGGAPLKERLFCGLIMNSWEYPFKFYPQSRTNGTTSVADPVWLPRIPDPKIFSSRILLYKYILLHAVSLVSRASLDRRPVS
jgi:hypothetical protein